MSDETYQLDPYEEQELDEQVKKIAAYQSKKQRQMADQAQQRIYAEAAKEISQELDVTESELQEIISQAPFDDASKMLKGAIKQHLKNLASVSKSPKKEKLRSADGRFRSQSSSSSRSAGPKDKTDEIISRILKQGPKGFLP